MDEKDWQKIGPGKWEYKHSKYTFRRTGAEGNYRYQLYINGKLADNTLTYFDIPRIIRDGYKHFKYLS